MTGNGYVVKYSETSFIWTDANSQATVISAMKCDGDTLRVIRCVGKLYTSTGNVVRVDVRNASVKLTGQNGMVFVPSHDQGSVVYYENASCDAKTYVECLHPAIAIVAERVVVPTIMVSYRGMSVAIDGTRVVTIDLPTRELFAVINSLL